jgi:Flp pilus assembly protein TadG
LAGLKTLACYVSTMGYLRKNFLSNEGGQIGVIFALAALPLLACMSAAIDYSRVTKERGSISSALDAAVLAAANNNAIELDEKDEYAATHFTSNYNGDLEITLTPSVTTEEVRLVAEGTLNLVFGNIIGIGDQDIAEASAATFSTDNTICVLALSEDADGAISYDADLEFVANNCSVHANSTSGSAILAERNLFKPTATSFCAVGGISGSVEPYSKGECSPIADPYETVPHAAEGVCKREFLIENTAIENGLIPPVDQKTPPLPTINPVPYVELLAELKTRHIKPTFGTTKGPKYEQSAAIDPVMSLGGDDMKALLGLYDIYGDKLDCQKRPVPECSAFKNPFLNTAQNETPRKGVVADIFDISYGNLVAPVTEPEIVTTGIVELVNGQLYSRNNIDNELVSVSANLTGGNIYLTPGTYCGGLTVDGINVRFAPGDYIFKDGPLTFLNKSQARADKVTLSFTGAGALMNIEGGSKLSIKAPTSGARKGLAFMQMVDRDGAGNRAFTSGPNRIASGGSLSMSGTAYFPQQTLMITGEGSHIGSNSPAVGLIADTIEFRGARGSRVELAVDHVAAGIPPIEPRASDGVRLIE